MGCNNSVFGNPCGGSKAQHCYYPKVTSSTTKTGLDFRSGGKIQRGRTKPIPTKICKLEDQ